MLEFQPVSFGDYILQDRIGAGGMAEIFLATAQGIEGFEKRLVIKRILPTLSDDEQFVRMFVEEAKLCVSLHHPNIVQVYDLGLIDGQYYIAMEYVDGRDLLKTLAACGRQKIGFPTDIALYIVMEVLKGLDYAHGLTKDGEPLGIIHRDVSPSNVLLSFEGEVKLGDFGIAKARTRERTATGILKGKFGYMAPEQVTGVPIDYRADVFAVGILLYELLTGHRLFAGKNDLAVLDRVRNADISPAPRYYRPDLDFELEHIVMRALAREPKQRFASCLELHDAIHDYVFRSRATVGPSLLARFMQALFLTDPAEQARRIRVRLPPIPGASPAFGPDDTEDERSAEKDDEITSEDLEVRGASSITDGGEQLEAPAAHPSTPSRAELRASLEAIRRQRPSSGFAPAEIVERSTSQPEGLDDESATGEIEARVRFDSTGSLPALSTRQLSQSNSTQTTAPPVSPDASSTAATPPDRPATPGELDDTVLNPERDGGADEAVGPAGRPTVRDPMERTSVDMPPVASGEAATEIEGAGDEDETRARLEGASVDDTPASEEPTRRGLPATLPDTPVPDEVADDAKVHGVFEDDESLPTEDALADVVSEAGDADEKRERPQSEARRPSSGTVSGPLDGDLYPDTAEDRDPPLGTRGRPRRPGRPTRTPWFDGKADPVVPAITDEGRLGDDGASGLFGALSVLDDPPEFGFEPEDNQSIDTEGRFYADFSESVGPPPASGLAGAADRRSSASEQRHAYGETRMGLLADPIDPDDGRVPSFVLHGSEATPSASDGQVMSASHEIRSELPEPEAYSMFSDRPSSVAGLRLEFGDDPADPFSYSTVNDHRQGGDRTRADPESDSDDTPLVALDSGLRWPSEARDPEGADFDGFELQLELEASEVAPAPRRQTSTEDGDIGPPVRPVSMVRAPGGVDDTASRMPQPVPVRGAPRGAAALRAVVGRKSRIRELNRAQSEPAGATGTPARAIGTPARANGTPARATGTPARAIGTPGRANGTPARAAGRAQGQAGRPLADPTPPMPSRAAPSRPGPARGSAGRVPARAHPSLGTWGGGTPSAPQAMLVHPSRSPWLTAAVYGLPLIAVLLTVAALVSSAVLPGQDESMLSEDGRYGRGVPVPQDEPRAPLSAGQDRPAGSARSDEVPSSTRRPAPADAPTADAEPEKGRPPPAAPAPKQAVDDGRDAASDRGVAVAPPPKRRARRPSRERRRRARPLGLIRVRCDEASVVRIVGVGAYRADPWMARRVPPGDYQVKLYRGGRVRSRVAIQVIADQSVKIPCP